MLEANPGLTPQQIKRILMETAERLPNEPIDRQGWGAVPPAHAVAYDLSLLWLISVINTPLSAQFYPH